ncbi:MAG: hypothetical protein KAJ64_02735, partial [Thermoplasmata archaeon]|nr:hypothetical protein [Thermoplasmata archaeon]
TISNSSANGNVSGSGYIGGLIGQNSNAGVITDCHATGIVNGTGDLVGGLIGYNDAGPVSNCSAAGDVSGSSYVGGLVGRNDDTISDSNTLEAYVNGTGSRVGGLVGLNYGDVIECEAHGHVYAVGGNAGGLIGDNNPGTSITNSSAYGDVTTEDIYCGGLTGRNGGIIENSSAYGNADAGTFGYVGGLVGDNMGGTILNSSALGDVDGGIRTGGFVGSNHGGTIERCFSMGDVNALVDQWHGGFIGLNYGASVKDCYSQGNVTGNDQVGGFIGNNSDGSSISNSYSTGFVTGNTNLGGFAGINADNAAVCTITDCTWDNETSGFATTGIGGGAIGSTTGNYTSEMKQQATFDPPWDFTDIWGIYETNTYPFLQTVGLTPIVEADLGLTVETSPLVQVGDPVTYYVNVTNNGLDNALNVNATLIGSGADMIYDGNNQSAVFWGGGLSWEISFLAAGETVWMQINLTANEGGIFTLDGTVTSDIDDPVAGNNDATADVDSNAPPIAVDDIEQTSEDDVKYCWTPGVLANE